MHPSSNERSQAYEALVRAHGDTVLRFLRRRTDRETADDVFSETMLVVWRRFDELPDDPVPWLFVAARNCLSTAERGTRRQTRLANRIAVVDPPQESYEHESPDDDDGARVREAVGRLRAADAELIRMWAWDELSAERMAAVLGITVNAVTIRLHRAKKKLQKELASTTTPHGSEREGAGT